LPLPEAAASIAGMTAASRDLVQAVFLDRDGVINRPIFRDGKPRTPKDFSEFAFMDGAHDVLRELRARGYLLVVCTNQPDVARGWQRREQVDEFHVHIERELPVARIYACFHDDADRCRCRKPKPGLLLQAQSELRIDPSQSWMVGDRQSDIDAGRAAGCRTVFMRHEYNPGPHDADHEIAQLSGLLDLIR
jgi:D-glycero-D-manno-heptose 1,7-bisphosphate phosphatase